MDTKKPEEAYYLALDAIALALYRASDQGTTIPEPEHLLVELVQEGWMLIPIESTPDPQNGTGPQRNGA